MLLNGMKAPREGYDYCARCYRLAKIENMREEGQFEERYGPK
jgi:hypothetical protein